MITSFDIYVNEMYNTFDDYTGPPISPQRGSGIDIRTGNNSGFIGGDSSRFGDICALPPKQVYKEEVPNTKTRETKKRRKSTKKLIDVEEELYKRTTGDK